ncbi:Rhabdoid tumor deletion region protein 1 [Fukomys damarensis]|uniref:Rhabdoid tumor deletion region protein 1 n=1 Tax=Fukomys damarensis TaxID=885580 RepID=A0A091CZP6_FUKDA|nr:Rhabdoid tumor deletion region protein 1 [Fukomys damarensis]
MAHARISMYLPPNINPTQADIAYGCWALPNLHRELQSEDLQTRQKALMALCDLMHDPEYVYEAINIGCLESLTALLKDSDSLVRMKTAEVLYIMATHDVGRTSLLEHDIILALSFLLNDPHSACRENLHQVYKQLAQLPSVPWVPLNRQREKTLAKHIQKLSSLHEGMSINIQLPELKPREK